ELGPRALNPDGPIERGQFVPTRLAPAAPDHGSITISRERITTWVLIDILELFSQLSTVICKSHRALIRHICSIKPAPGDEPAILDVTVLISQRCAEMNVAANPPDWVHRGTARFCSLSGVGE